MTIGTYFFYGALCLLLLIIVLMMLRFAIMVSLLFISPAAAVGRFLGRLVGRRAPPIAPIAEQGDDRSTS